MKKLNYFLFFLLPLAFTSYAQEENSGLTIRPCGEKVHYYIDGVKVTVNKDLPTRILCQSFIQQSASEDDLVRNRVFTIREQQFDLAFHNAHTGKNVGLVLLIDNNEIKEAAYRTSISNRSNFMEAEDYFNYGENEFFQQQPGILNTRNLYAWRALKRFK